MRGRDMAAASTPQVFEALRRLAAIDARRDDDITSRNDGLVGQSRARNYRQCFLKARYILHFYTISAPTFPSQHAITTYFKHSLKSFIDDKHTLTRYQAQSRSH